MKIVFAFLIFALLRMTRDGFFRQWMTFSGGSFERYGTGWIILSGIYCGFIGILWYFAVVLIQRKPLVSLMMCSLAFIFIALDCFYADIYQNSFVDLAIRRIGYLISRVNPYIPQDRPINGQAALPPNTCVTLETTSGQLTLCSGNGTLRSFMWNNKKRAIELSPAFVNHKPVWHFPKKSTGELWPGYCWEDNAGIKRCFYQEKQEFFPTEQSMYKWLEVVKRDSETVIICPEGYVFSIYFKSNQEALTVWVNRVSVDGKYGIPASASVGNYKFSYSQ